jgi:SAM-dependent methyltransferase
MQPSTLDRFKAAVKARLSDDTLIYNALAWGYGAIAGKPGVRRNAIMRARRDSRFEVEDLAMASLLPTHLLEAVMANWHPRTVLDVGCGTGRAVQYLAQHGIDCIGLEGSRAAIDASPVRDRLACVNLNRPVILGRSFDVVWSYEVAEHIHPHFTDTFVSTLTSHGPTIVLSAAQPGQGGCGHFNEQLPSYWIQKIEARGFRYLREASAQLQALPDEFARNVMAFTRSSATEPR